MNHVHSVTVYIIFSFSFLSNGIFVQKANTLKIDKFKEIAFLYIWFLYYEYDIRYENLS
jgi:L-asparaginase/Glu-tRNA(Gln) amidotransferase subunit D